jgi:short-subunit dehydrogenase
MTLEAISTIAEPTGKKPIALITGASAGFGNVFAHRFAALGYDLVLVARRKDRMLTLAGQLTKLYKTSSLIIPADLSDPTATQNIYKTTHQKGLSLSVLVNNAGFATCDPLLEEDPERIATEIMVDVYALTVLTRLYLPELLQAQNGLLVNVASIASFQPLPNASVYAASKAYVRSFTESIWQECADTPLSVIALCPGPSPTEIWQVADSNRIRMGQELSPEEIVAAVFNEWKKRRVGPLVTPGWLNAALSVSMRFTPEKIKLPITAFLTNRHPEHLTPSTIQQVQTTPKTAA